MAEHGSTVRDVANLVVPRGGRVEETGDRSLPFRLLDDQGVEVAAVTEFLHHMLADDASPASLRSYAYELLSWQRFLRAVEVPWHLAGRSEARDFALWFTDQQEAAPAAPPRRAGTRIGEPGHRQGDFWRQLRSPDQTARSRGDPVVL